MRRAAAHGEPRDRVGRGELLDRGEQVLGDVDAVRGVEVRSGAARPAPQEPADSPEETGNDGYNEEYRKQILGMAGVGVLLAT